MFHSALIRPHADGVRVVDAGTVAETLLFYGKVQVAADYGLLEEMLRTIGPYRFYELVKEGLLSISYSKFRNGVLNNTSGYLSKYILTFIQIARKANGQPVTAKSEIREIVSNVTGSTSRASKKLAEQLIEAFSIKGGFVDDLGKSALLAHEELDDSRFLKSAVSTLISDLVPTYSLPNVWEFRPIHGDDGDFYIYTNLDLEKINFLYSRTPNYSGTTINVAFFLLQILEARADADLAAEYMAELVTKRTNSDLIRLKINNILKRRQKSQDAINVFQDVVFDNARAIREVLNSGERTFEEFFPILEKSRKFKDWIVKQNPDASLVHEYHDTLIADSWLASLPIKGLRYVLSSGAGVVHPVAGLALAAADEFLVDKFFSGWRPSHFVNGPLKSFVEID
jgi:hypothetical protein